MDYLNEGVERFFEFSRHRNTFAPDGGNTHRYLQDFLHDWLREPYGGGIEFSGRNAHTWARLCFRIGDAVFRDPSLLDYRPNILAPSTEQYTAMTPDEVDALQAASQPKPRPLDGFIDTESALAVVYEPEFYESMVWAQDHPSLTTEAQVRGLGASDA